MDRKAQNAEAPKQQDGQTPTDGAAASGNQRVPELMINVRVGNTIVRDGKCYILFRSEMDPRWPEPQFIDETVVIDRNRLESVNLQRLNPDVAERTKVKCICTRLINLLDDWYAHLHDGTILCTTCARCFRCRTLCFTAGRKLTSVDGFLLCNTCMLSYGRYRETWPRIRIQPLPKSLGDMELEAGQQEQPPADPPPQPAKQQYQDDSENTQDEMDATAGASHNYYNRSNNRRSIYNSKNVGSNNQNKNKSRRRRNHSNAAEARQQRSQSSGVQDSPAAADSRHSGAGNGSSDLLLKPRYRQDGRRPLRLVLYADPRPANYGRPDFRFEAPPYLAVDRNTPANGQACPQCGQQALTEALVVPGLARVYHERAFHCTNCRKPMHAGYQLPMVQFESCCCPQQPPLVWCTLPACRQARMLHHTEKGCCLEPVHPGGRPKRDVPGLLPRFDPREDARLLAEAVRKMGKLTHHQLR